MLEGRRVITDKAYFLAATILIILAVGSLLFFALPKEEGAVVRIGYNIDSINHAPLIIADELNLFEKNGLKVEFVLLASGKEIKQAIGSGQIEIGSAGLTNFFIPIAKNAPIKVIAPSTVSGTLVFVNPKSGIKTLEDLVWKNVASWKGQPAKIILYKVLQTEDINAQSINIVEIDRSLFPIALMEKGVVDAALAGTSDAPTFFAAGAEVLEEWDLKGYGSIADPKTVIAVNTDFMEANPQKMDLFIQTFIESQKFIHDNPDEAAKLISEKIAKETKGAISFSETEVKDSWGSTKYSLWYDPQIFEEFAKYSFQSGDVDKELSLEDIFDSRFEVALKKGQCEIYGEC